ncbi:VC0807 family protein [Nocardia crassostreae]|uniref:VC0807 family protein n=1 Tax=Nocardia crassostreae TaxID=53428 RepID=UPI0008334B6A|nr:VC0807 family protein [Nocardia crassostreae]
MNVTTAAVSGADPIAGSAAPGRPSLLRMLAPIIRDLAVPVAAYFALKALGYSDFLALLLGAVCSALIVVVEVIRARRIDPLAAIVLGGFVIGLIGSMISGDARTLVIRDSFGTAAVGLAFLISALISRPLTYAAARKFLATTDPAHLPAMEEAYRTVAAVSRAHLRLSVMWGAGLLGEAVLRIVLAYRLSVSTMAWLSSVLMVATMSVLMTINIRAVKKLRQQNHDTN